MASIVAVFYARRLAEFDEAVRRRTRRSAAYASDASESDGSDGSDDDVDADADAMDLDDEGGGSFATKAASCVEVMGDEWARTLAAVSWGVRGARTEDDVAADVAGDDCAAGAFAAVAEAAAARALETAVRRKVSASAEGKFDRRALPRLLRWLKAVPLEFIRVTGDAPADVDEDAAAATGNASASASAREWRARLEYAIHEHLGALRIGEFFDVIVEFPESLPAVEDLKQCLRRTTLHAQLTTSLRQAIQRRLLIAGAPTADIIEQYRLTIRALRALDPSGVVLNIVSGPLKEYLRGRKDTIRCVVTMLMGRDDAGESDALLGADDDARLLGEDASGDGGGREQSVLDAWQNDPEFSVDPHVGPVAAGSGEVPGDGDGGTHGVGAETTGARGCRRGASGWDEWEPEPVESEAASSRGRHRDIDDELGYLIGIYGSKELLINEYRNMLAERLLNKVGYDVDRDTHTLELLKLRFGESSLHKCEVMLKDMNDSKRINGGVKAPPAPNTPAARDATSTEVLRESPLDATVVSALFWPPFANEAPDFVLPRAMKEMMDAYGKRYHHLKAPRQMHWKPTLGTVQLEVMHGDIELELSVSPVEATVLMHFQTKHRWGLDELASEMGVTKAVLRRKAVVWINQGILVEEKGEAPGASCYRLTSGEDSRATFGAAAADDEGGSGTAVASAEDQAAAGMKVYEQYIVGMLTNFPSLPLDRIHNMLKMFVADPPYDKSVDQLEAFLNQLIAEDKLVLEGTQYRKR